MTRTEQDILRPGDTAKARWKRDWSAARAGATLRAPAADLLFCRGLPDSLLIARDLRPHWAAWLRAATTYSHVAGIHIQNPPKSMRRLKGLR